ncbi:FAD-dependent oxidoreductase [Ruegeria arenilitoris]|uniref:FAD-dependent oxidoreductase n=1 Tax=Ruegeria arenilitoris TaxID=1173585 RepID=UPI001480A317|nr:FAD-dependent oxidoreductase [Ruegeria arenilitoris]
MNSPESAGDGTITTSVAIVGAGIVGVATALNLQRKGLDVVLVDEREPGEGAS